MTFNLEVVRKGREQTLGERCCGRWLCAIHPDEDKFVTAETRKECCSGSYFQAPRNFN